MNCIKWLYPNWRFSQTKTEGKQEYQLVIGFVRWPSSTFEWMIFLSSFEKWKTKTLSNFQYLLLSLFSSPFEQQQQLTCSPEEKRSLGSEKNTFMSCLKKRNSLLKYSLCHSIVFKWKRRKVCWLFERWWMKNGGWEKGVVSNKTRSEEDE